MLETHACPMPAPSIAEVRTVSARLPKPGANLITAYATRNLGDAAIMRALAALVPGGVACRHLDNSPIVVPGVSHTSEPLRLPLRISVGGDIFNNSRPRLVTRTFLTKLAELAYDPARTILFGQTIPTSCDGLSLGLLTRALRRLPVVVVRDRASLALLRARGVEARLSWDVAFTNTFNAAALSRARALFDQSQLVPERTVLLSVRPFDAMYNVDGARFTAMLQTLCLQLLARGHQVALMIQSDVGAWDEDRTIASTIAQADPRIRVCDFLANEDDPDPVATLAAALSIANIAVGVRYHTTVLSLAAGRQPFNLYYSRKGYDLQERLGLSGCAVAEVSGLETIRAIENTADATFNPRPVAEHVRSTFSEALQAVRT